MLIKATTTDITLLLATYTTVLQWNKRLSAAEILSARNLPYWPLSAAKKYLLKIMQ